MTGEVANAVATPLMMIGEVAMALGRGARDSQFGQSAKYGWDRAERRKKVFHQKRSLREVSLSELQSVLRKRGVPAQQILDMNENQIRRMVADITTPDPYLDEETYVGQVLENAEPEKAPVAPTMTKIPDPALAPA